jgi:Zn-finger nucleic acid-binding protein
MDTPLDDLASLRPAGPLRCPKCRATMAAVPFAGVEVDRCTGCGGLWFDMLEHEQLKDQEGSEAIDSGDRELGARYDKVGLVRCPIDDQQMVRMVDRAQPTLWFESCPLCYGVFFDAGEFAEYREDRLRNLFVRHRRRRPL